MLPSCPFENRSHPQSSHRISFDLPVFASSACCNCLLRSVRVSHTKRASRPLRFGAPALSMASKGDEVRTILRAGQFPGDCPRYRCKHRITRYLVAIESHSLHSPFYIALALSESFHHVSRRRGSLTQRSIILTHPGTAKNQSQNHQRRDFHSEITASIGDVAH